MSTLYEDNRGSLTSIKDVPFEVSEILVSNNNENIFRGLHMSPYKKRVYVTKGKIYDIIINPNTLEKKELILSVGDYIDVPENWAHGFFSYENSTILYLLSGKFNVNKDINIYWKDPHLNLELNFPQEQLIISEKDRNAKYFLKNNFFVLGARGYLGSHCVKILRNQGYSVFESNDRFNEITSIREKIIKSNAKYIICAAGISGKPTIDWCEKNEQETYDVNYTGVLNIVKITKELGLHCTIFGSGLVYSGNKKIYDENDEPDYTEKVYSRIRIELENALKQYNNVLYLRIIFPVTYDNHPKCFISKIKTWKEIHNINIPITIVPLLFKGISKLCIDNIRGIFNFVNNGTISLQYLVQLYSFYNNNNNIQAKIINSTNARGNYQLTTSKLEKYITVNDLTHGLIDLFKK
jgi:dTDP-4-dehydrorhamnose 3,5-epimerase-like enzyme/dTDP-4-dehydrorhamnose reductase